MVSTARVCARVDSHGIDRLAGLRLGAAAAVDRLGCLESERIWSGNRMVESLVICVERQVRLRAAASSPWSAVPPANRLPCPPGR